MLLNLALQKGHLDSICAHCWIQAKQKLHTNDKGLLLEIMYSAACRLNLKGCWQGSTADSPVVAAIEFANL